MIGPWIHALFERGRKISDIEYQSIKEFDGKLVTGEGSGTATGDLVTKTASGGKDMYVASAKIIAKRTSNAVGNKNVEVVLKANGTIVETASLGFHYASGEGGSSVLDYQFIWKGKVATGQIIKLEIISIDSSMNVDGILVLFEEDTGASPAIS